MREWRDGVGVSRWLFRFGCGALLAISASEIRWIIGYLHFHDVVFFKKKRMVLSHQGVKKQYGNPFGSCTSALAMLVVNTWRKIDFPILFYDVIHMERQFIRFGIVVDILDRRPRHNLTRDHRNSKALFFFFTHNSHCT